MTDDDRGNPIFGDWTGIARGDGARVLPTPVGVECLWCREPIAEGDTGEFLGSRRLPVHRECMMLGILGHRFGVCDCTDYAKAATKRAAALELARRVDLLGALRTKGSIDELIAASSIGGALADIMERGIEAHLADPAAREPGDKERP